MGEPLENVEGDFCRGLQPKANRWMLLIMKLFAYN